MGGRLVPFFKCVCVYFVALGAGGAGPPSPGAVAAKCAPVLCLLLVVALHAAAAPAHKSVPPSSCCSRPVATRRGQFPIDRDENGKHNTLFCSMCDSRLLLFTFLFV